MSKPSGLLVIGDIHAKTDNYLNLLRRYKGMPSVQLGDFGWGFGDVPELPEDAWFIRGNHDNPFLARLSPHYLGDFGVREIGGVKFFFVSGAWSSDRGTRIEGRDWWHEEELSIAELNAALDLYMETKPDIVLTHDGPDIATDIIHNRFVLHKRKLIPTRTAQALNAMYEVHQPKQWIFGHWHTKWREDIGPTNFRCLPELGWCELHVK